jgi:hypothetical protein
MIEALLVATGLLAATAMAMAPWPLLMQGGAAIAALGILFGIPAGLAYHLRLRQELIRLGQLADQWWWQPVAQHRFLDPAGHRRVHRSFRLGAAGCGVIFLGCFIVLVGLLRSSGGLGAV